MADHTDVVAAAPTIRVAPSAGAAGVPQAVAPIAPPLGPGDRIGRYEVRARIGQGGMGEVYRARDPELDRMVAIKLVHRRAATDALEQRALVAEAQALAQLSHPNVVSLYDAQTHDGQVFVAMELVEGQTLQRWLGAPGHRDWRAILDVFVGAGQGLMAAHAAGIVHGDFKPTNVMIAADGRPRVFDFGLARAVGDGSPSAQDRSGEHDGVDRTVRGTPAFMAPEQLRGDPLGPATDQFAFCVALHRALWGAAPYPGDTLDELRRSVSAGALQLAPDRGLPAGLRRVVARGLAVDPAARHPSMAALLTALDRVRGRRRRLVLGSIGAAVVLCGGVALAWPRPASCDAGAVRSAAIWTAPRRDAVVAALGQPSKAYVQETVRRVTTTLDAYVTRWNEVHREACEAARGGDEGTLDAAMACLGDALSELDATATLLTGADETITTKAAALAAALPDPGRCTGAVLGRYAGPADATAAGFRDRLAIGRAATRAARFDDAVATIQGVLDDPRLPAYPPIHADATLLLAEARDFGGDRDLSLPLYREGIALAAAARSTLAETRGWIHLIRVAGNAAQFDEADHALKQAELWIERLARDGELNATLTADLYEELGVNAGTMEIARGDYAAAVTRFEAGLALSSGRGASPERAAALLNNLGAANGMLGQHARAREYFARGAKAKSDLHGPDHPDVATCMLNEAVALHQLGEHQQASDRFKKVIEIRIAALGPDHAELGTAYNSLATAEHALGNDDEALALYRKALAIRERTLGVDHQSTAITRNNLADTLLDTGRPAEARPHVEEALAHLQRRLGERHPLVAYPLHTLGELRMALGEYDAAIAALEQAIAIREAQSLDPHDLALTRFSLAQALRAAGRDPTRARALALAAQQVLRGTLRSADVAAQIDRWLEP